MENAYNFLNQSLRHYRKTGRTIKEWPFALLHITQSLELMLKQRLSEIHPLLIYENINHPKNTVSLEQALARLEQTGISVGEKEKINIRRAADYRNLVVHYQFELNKYEWKRNFAQLFEFVHFFHVEHLNREVHSKIAKDNWSVEARLMTYFKENFVVYNNLEMHKDNPKAIIDAQRISHSSCGGRKLNRIRYGEESEWLQVDPRSAGTPCHDCYVVKGQYHIDGCDVERCPHCLGQRMCCGCE